MIGFIGATVIEMKNILNEIEPIEEKSIGGFEFVVGNFGGQKIVAVKSGVGKVFMAACCQTMILNFDIDLILNIGAAGSLNKDIHLGDVVLADKTVQYDMDTTECGDPFGMISGINQIYFYGEIKDGLAEALKAHNYNSFVGGVATADLFLNNTDTKEMIVREFGCVCTDMELGAMAQICYINNVKFESIKYISDNADDISGKHYESYMENGSEKISELLKIRLSIV